MITEEQFREAFRARVQAEASAGDEAFSAELGLSPRATAAGPIRDVSRLRPSISPDRSRRPRWVAAAGVAAALILVATGVVRWPYAPGETNDAGHPAAGVPGSLAPTVIRGEAPIVEEPEVHSVGPWADAVLPELDLMVINHPTVFTTVRVTERGHIELATVDPRVAEPLLRERLAPLELSEDLEQRITLVQVKQSRTDLQAIIQDIASDETFQRLGANLISIEPGSNRVLVSMLDAPLEYRRDLYARYGDAVAITLTESPIRPEVQAPPAGG